MKNICRLELALKDEYYRPRRMGKADKSRCD